MRELPARDSGWLGVQLEVSRRLRTDPAFRMAWEQRLDTVRNAAIERLARGRESGVVRDDVPIEVLAAFLQLVLDGLVLHLANGVATGDAAAVLDLAEEAVRRPAGPAVGSSAAMDDDFPATTHAREASA
jgi:hypothetical protein